MGLDIYLSGKKFYWTNWREPEKNITEDGFKLTEKQIELGYWRKHPNLHGFIVKTFAKEIDDCKEIELDEQDIDTIISAIKEKLLPYTEGFYFGKSENSEEEKEQDIKIFDEAKKWLLTKEKGVSKSIVYQASW